VIDKLVDTGMLLHQTSVQLDPTWGLHDIASANYLTACEDVGKVLKFTEHMVADSVSPTPDPTLATKGKTFTKRDWHPAMLIPMYETWQDSVAKYAVLGHLGKLDWPQMVEIG
jgi:hypothetical protein